MSHFLIVSPNGYGNVGDDICPYSAGHIVKSINSQNTFSVVAPPFKKSQVMNADGVILGGGGPIYDRVEENVENYMEYLECAQRNGKLSAVMGVGVQGIVTDWGKKRYSQIFNKCDMVTTRTISDKKMLDEIGCNNVVATQDLGLIADEWVKKPRFARRLKTGAKPRLGLILVDVRTLLGYKTNPKLRDYIDVIEKHMPQLAEDFEIWLFAHSKDDDEWRAHQAKKYGLKTVPYKTIKDFPRFFNMYKQMDIIVGVRFHSIILGVLARKPVIGVSSHGTKQWRFAEEVSPTVKKHFVTIHEIATSSQIFADLRKNYDQGVYEPVPDKELANMKALVWKNKDLLEAAMKKRGML